MRKFFSVHDLKSEVWTNPYYELTTASGIREFEQIVNDEGTKFYHHPADYDLYELGEFDETSGVITVHSEKMFLGNALSYKKEL